MSKTPSYYIGKYKGIHVQDVLVDFELDKHHNIAAAVEYLLRCMNKHDDPRQDIQKAIDHLNLYLKHPKFNVEIKKEEKLYTTPKE